MASSTSHLIHHRTGFFNSHDGLSLYYQQWWNLEQLPRAIVVIVHGLGAHSGLFENVVQALVPAGYHIYALDLRGHGRSPGKRGFIQAWSDFRGDVDALIKRTATEQPQIPCFLIGHSVGGAVVLDYALHHPHGLTGIIVSNPALGAISISPIKLAIARLLSQVWPNFSLSTGVTNSSGARDPEIVASYDRDPLRHAIGSARLATEFLATTESIYANAKNLNLPVLILQSGSDSVTLPAGSERFFNSLPQCDKTRKVYPDSYHEIYDDLDCAMVLEDVRQWLTLHLGASDQP